MSKGLFILRLLCRHLGVSSLLTVYYAFIYSHLNYGIILWGNHSSISKLFVLQKSAVRIIYGASSRSHCRPVFSKLGILTLPSMYVLSCLLYVKRIVNSFIVNGDFHSYSTRNRHNLYPNKNKYVTIKNSFESVSKKLFNSLPLFVKELPVNIFKSTLRSALAANPIYSVEEFYNIKWQ